MTKINYPFGIDGEKIKKAYNYVTAEENRILKNGGYVHGNNEDRYKTTLFIKITIFVAIIGFLVSILLCLFLEKKDWCYWGIVTSLAALTFSVSTILDTSLSKKGFYVRPSDGKAPDNNELGSYGLVGITLNGNFRYVGKTYVSYKFLTFIVPIIPLACYRVTSDGTYNTGYNEKTTFYRIYGSEKWYGIEILQIYLFNYSIMTLIGCIIAMLIMIF